MSRRRASLALVLYCLLWLAYLVARREPSWVSVWDLMHAESLVRWIAHQARTWLLAAVAAVPIGALSAVAAGPGGSRGVGRVRGLLLAAGLTLGVLIAGNGALPGPVAAASGLAGAAAGAWLAAGASRGVLGRRTATLLVSLAGAAAVAGGLAYVALEPRPMNVEMPKVTSEDKRRIYSMMQTVAARNSAQRHVRLTTHDVNVLLAWGLSLGSADRAAAVDIAEGALHGRASLRLPLGPLGARYVNVTGTTRVSIEQGRARLRIDRLRVGRLSLPRPVLAAVPLALGWTAHADADARRLLASVTSLRLDGDAVDVVMRRGSVNNLVLPALMVRLGSRPEALAATRDHVRHLVQAAPSLPRGEARFAAFLRAAMEHAAARSARGDPVQENRAAILALGMLLGHWRVEQFVGPTLAPEERARAAREIGRVTLRERTDWPRHFWVSAALTLVSSEPASDATGVFKEEVDAGGGSGFSFADLLADRAGTRFALAATRDAEAARAMQERLRGPWHIDDLFPPAADLPEGLQDAALRARIGEVGSPAYQTLLAEIERRLDGCVLLR